MENWKKDDTGQAPEGQEAGPRLLPHTGYKGNVTSKECGNIVRDMLKEQEKIMASHKDRTI